MTFGVSRDAGAFEWSGTSGSALFAQPGNALKPAFWRMIFADSPVNLASRPNAVGLASNIGAFGWVVMHASR